MTEMTQQDFLAKYGTLISQTILKNNISYTTEKMPMYKGQRYYINTKDVYLFVLQMQDPTHLQEMLLKTLSMGGIQPTVAYFITIPRLQPTSGCFLAL